MSKYLLLAAILIASPAAAGQQFAAYEGPDAVQQGSGGTRIVKDGVDFWTTGTPPRRFRILGRLIDSRRDKPLSGHAIGSAGLAKKVKEMGGNALILLDQESRNAGQMGMLNALGGSVRYSARDAHKINTEFVVVQYLD